MEKIDFVVTWVDSNDKKWLEDKNLYDKKNLDIKKLNDASKYRDWEFFKYWFRAVEKYAPWVNKIHLVTYGHVPEWLNESSEKLNVVTHNQILPVTALPTFNSQAIELALNKIKGLSENFVYFNDDMFLNDYVIPEDFFLDGLPKDYGLFNAITPHLNGIEHTIVNNIELINERFDKKEVIKKNLNKFFNIKYGLWNIRNVLLLPWQQITGFYEPHTAVALKKSTFNIVVEKEYKAIQKTIHNKFRTKDDVNFWIVRYWQICLGQFIPQKKNFSKMYYISSDNNLLFKDIKESNSKIICLNDSDSVFNYEKTKKEIKSIFLNKFAEKSMFEK